MRTPEEIFDRAGFPESERVAARAALAAKRTAYEARTIRSLVISPNGSEVVERTGAEREAIIDSWISGDAGHIVAKWRDENAASAREKLAAAAGLTPEEIAALRNS